MKNHQKAVNRQQTSASAVCREWLVVLLFFAGVALIAAGLWCIWPPVSLIFIGVAVLYLAMCVSKVAKSPVKDG
jgi:hypothetical protein